MARRPYRPPELKGKLFISSEAIAKGLITEHQLRSSAWQRLMQGVYADSDLPLDHELMCRAATLRYPGAVIAGPSAVYLAGARHLATAKDKVHVVVPIHRVCHDVVFHQVYSGSIRAQPHTLNLRRQPVIDAVWDSCQWLPGPQAAGVADAALHNNLTTMADFHALLASKTGLKWSRLADRVLRSADPNMRHPHLSAIRYALLDSGLAPTHTMFPVHRPPRPPMVVDLAWPHAQVAIVIADQKTATALALLGWQTFIVHPTKPPDLNRVVTHVHNALNQHQPTPRTAPSDSRA